MYADPLLTPPPELFDNFRTMDPALLDSMAGYKSPEEVRKERLKIKGKSFLEKLGKGVDSVGGFGAIGSTADQIRNLIGRKDQVFDSSANQNQVVVQPVPEEKDKMSGWAIAGLVLLGLAATGTVVVLVSKALSPA